MGDEPTMQMSAATALAERAATPMLTEQREATYRTQPKYTEMYSELAPMLPARVNRFLGDADKEHYPETRVAAGLDLLADLLERGSLEGESRADLIARRTKSFRDMPLSLIPGSNSIDFDAVVDAYASHAVYVKPATAVEMCRNVMADQLRTNRRYTTASVLYEMRDRLREESWAAREVERVVSVENARIPPTDAMMVRYMAKQLK